jgi:hypothetical protein
MTEQDVYDCLQRKLQVLDKIAANTATQIRFVHKLQLKGLGRMLKERADLINELAMVNKELVVASYRVTSPEFHDLLAVIAKKQYEIIVAGNQALQNAIGEQESIKDKLYRIRAGRRMQSQYLKRWLPTCGNHINAKG